MSSKETAELMTRCVNAHDRCGGGTPCPYCEPVLPLRTGDGRFASRVASPTPTEGEE